MNAVITPVGQLLGEADIPGDKSISHRGIMFGSLARGTTRLTNFLKGDDCLNTINAFRSMGIDIDIEENDGNTGEIVLVHGKGLRGLKNLLTSLMLAIPELLPD
jgi:3-phosphoshikimate 1-carboxyvinyltransferase